MHERRRRRSDALVAACAVAVLAANSSDWEFTSLAADDETIEAVLDGELSRELRRLNRSLMNLGLPAAGARSLFADRVDVVDLRGRDARTKDDADVLDIDIRHWKLSQSTQRANDDELSIWHSFVADVDYFRSAEFEIVRGNFVEGDRARLRTLVKFEGLARAAPGFRFARAEILIDWARESASNGSAPELGDDEVLTADWRIQGWETTHFETHEVSELLFTDVLAEALDAPLYRSLSARSAELEHRIAVIVVNSENGRSYDELATQLDDRLLPYTRAEVDEALEAGSEEDAAFVDHFFAQLTRERAYIAGAIGVSTERLAAIEEEVKSRLNAARGKQRPWVLERVDESKQFRGEVNALYRELSGDARSGATAIAVTDIDRDGFDDIFVSHNRRSFLLRNRGDGTFEDYTAVVDLPQPDSGVNAALFIDTDNDSDLDLFLGLWDDLRYYINDNGRFVDRTDDLLDAYRPRGNVAMSAADYDGDGLIDIYVQTRDMFRPMRELMARANLGSDDGKLFGALLPETQARRFYEAAMAETSDAVFDRPAPPNMLLHNLGGGKFGIAPDTAHLELYRGTHFAAWADYDGDGDPDLYVANDFGPNSLFRNDDGVLVDVTEETNTTDVGFGMGVSWGDFDNDLDQDLYVTNMYSTAGLRITAAAGLEGTRAQLAAHGNTLFQNTGGRFEKVSGAERPAFTVEAGGWGWGAQFLDVDNDGFLDIYAPSGYISTPTGFAPLADT